MSRRRFGDFVVLPDRPDHMRRDEIVLPAYLWEAAEMAGLDLTGYVKEQPQASYDANIIERRRNFLEGR